jgi:MSHA pilin protein MshC
MSMLIHTSKELKSRLPVAGRTCFNPQSTIRNPKSEGFTLIELIMIIVLLGIIAVFAAPRLGNITSTNAGAFRDKLRADIRYAQNLAMTRNQRYRVFFNAAPAPAPNGYAVVNDANGNGTWGEVGPPNEITQDPAGGGNLSVTLNTGDYVGITITSPANGYVEFNSLGAPAVGGGLAFIASVATITINASATTTVTIQDQTGAVN